MSGDRGEDRKAYRVWQEPRADGSWLIGQVVMHEASEEDFSGSSRSSRCSRGGAIGVRNRFCLSRARRYQVEVVREWAVRRGEGGNCLHLARFWPVVYGISADSRQGDAP